MKKRFTRAQAREAVHKETKPYRNRALLPRYQRENHF